MNLYHRESQSTKTKYSKVIRKVQLQIHKLKDICVEIIGESGGEVLEGSATDRLIIKVGEIMEKLNAEYQELVDSESPDRVIEEGLEIIEEENENAENRSMGTPKSQGKELHFTPKSVHSQK